MRYPRPHGPALGVAAATCCLAAVAGCTAHTDVGATGAAPADATHLWVTVEEVWFATAVDTLPDSPTGWTRKALSKPVVLDLATASSSTLVALATNLSLQSGTYRQMHLELADSGDQLTGAARDAGLAYNAQIERVDDKGAKSKAALELPVPRAGLTIPIELTIKDRSGSSSTAAENRSSSLAITLDASRDVVTYDYGSNKGYILSPAVSVDDEEASGSIEGRVDASALATDHPAITVSAQERDSSGTHRVVVQRRKVADDGSFVLYPLPAAKSGKTSYDVVITCAGADTVIVRDVPVTAGATASATTVQSTPIQLSSARTVYADVEAQSPALPVGTRVEFYQARSGSDGDPYVIDGAAVEPLTQQLPDGAFALSAGSMVVGTYSDGGAISFASETPSEGSGGYVVGTAGQYRDDTLARNSVTITGGSSRPSVVAAPYPVIASAGRAGTLTVNVQVPIGRFDAGFISVSSGSRLMETVTLGTLLERGGGIVTIGGLPAGTGLVSGTGVPYQVSLRAWNSRNAAGTLTRVAAAGSVALGDSGTASVVLQAQ